MRNPQQAALDPRNSGCRQDCLGDFHQKYDQLIILDLVLMIFINKIILVVENFSIMIILVIVIAGVNKRLFSAESSFHIVGYCTSYFVIIFDS